MGWLMKLRNTLFSGIVAVVLLAPVSLYSLVGICEIDIPSEYTAQGAAWLTGGVSEAHLRDHLSLEDFERGELQDSAEKALGNYIPAKSYVLLGNAFVQRACIAASNAAFGWECYPTFYGSAQLYVPASYSLAEMPMYNGTKVLAQDELLSGVEEFGAGLAEIAGRHPDKRFRVFIADRTATSLANPAYSLVSKSFSTDDCAEILRKATNGCDNISIYSKTYSGPREYYNYFYPTDHHWNGFGALDSAALCSDLSRDASVHSESTVDFGKLCFNGTLSRRGLFCLNRSPIIEPKLFMQSFSVDSDSEEYARYLLSSDGDDQLERLGQRAEYNFYGEWYGGDRSMEISNVQGQEDEALLICDSYGDAFRWIVAECYGKTHSLIDFKKSEYTVDDFESWISKFDCRDVYIVGWAGNFTHMRAE